MENVIETAGVTSAQLIAWMEDSNEYWRGSLAKIPAEGFAKSSRLPGWTVAHLVAHINGNAIALLNLLSWAKTGRETPMYESAFQRNNDIEAGSKLSPLELTEGSDRLIRKLRLEISTFTPELWSATVRTARGREIHALEVPWMRAKELWIHAIDLGVGASLSDMAIEAVALLFDDLVAGFASREDISHFSLVAVDTGQTGAIGISTETGPTVEGHAFELCEWLIGRSSGKNLRLNSGRLPKIPEWL